MTSASTWAYVSMSILMSVWPIWRKISRSSMPAAEGAIGMNDELLTARQAAERLGVTAETIYALCRANRLAHYRIGAGGGSIRIRPSDLRRYLRGCRVESAVPAPPRGMGSGRPLKHITLKGS
jgi:excisionase family DNA binding protein